MRDDPRAWAHYTCRVIDWELLESGDLDAADDAVEALLDTPATRESLEQLHRLVTDPGHRSHQRVIRELQRRRDPSSAPVLRAALTEGFDRYAYTCSEDGVIAKWFGWALAEIGTPQAIEVLNTFARSENPEISTQMKYRLAKLSAHSREKPSPG